MKTSSSLMNGRTHFARLLPSDLGTVLSISARAWQIIAGLGTIFVVAIYFSPAQQGYFFTFQSLIAAQTLIDLGLGLAIVQFCAHERAGLRLTRDGGIVGHQLARNRVLDIAIISQHWFAAGSVVFAATMTPLGIWLFSNGALERSEWLWPWTMYVCTASINIWVIPMLAVAEGLGQVSETALVRTSQILLGSLALWSLAWFGAGLWAASGFQLGMLVASLVWLVLRRRGALAQIFRHLRRERLIDWRQEVGKFQLKLAICWACGYFMYHTMSPIIFHSLGPVAAGQFGMSQSISVSIGILGLAWVYAKAPMFGHLISNRERHRLNQTFTEVLLGSSAFVACLSCILLLGIWIADQIGMPVASRLLSPLDFALLLSAALVNHLLATFAMYIRAHKVEHFTELSAVGAVLIIVATWIGCNLFQSLTSVTLAFMLINTTILLPWGYMLYRLFRQEYETHGKATAASRRD